MANDNTAIQWTDATLNPVTGCDRVSAGCDHCYALDLAARLKAMGNPRYQNDGKPPTSGPGFGVTLHPDVLEIPLRWQKPRLVFVNSMSDLWHAKVPQPFIERVFAMMAATPRHTYQILTKRPQRMQRLMTAEDFVEGVQIATMQIHLPHKMPGYATPKWPGWPLPNVWLGVSVENQKAAYRIDWLVKTPAAVRFLSCEPLLGPLDLGTWLWNDDPCTPGLDDGCPDTTRDLIHWVICGAESGRNARPMDEDWARSLRDQCVDAGAPFFLKQFAKNGKKIGTPALDGVQWVQMPSN